jgi:hypothetical protein
MADGHPTGDRDAAAVDPRADACPPGIIINEAHKNLTFSAIICKHPFL